MSEKITPEEHRLWVIFHQTYDILTRCEENVISETGITNQQLLVLWLMEFMTASSDTPIIITDLAPSLFRSINSISSIIYRMEENGLVEKVRDLKDRRAIRLKITPKGEETFNTALKPSRALIKRVFSTFTDEERETLLHLLKKMKDKVIEEYGIDEVKIDPELSNQDNIAKFLKRENI
jgi:DNA-binding MarR family transcriptional regulator